MRELCLLHKTSDFMAQIELLCIQEGLSLFCYRQVTNIPQVKENASSCMGVKGQFWWFWLHFKDTQFHLNMIQRAVMCRWNHHPIQNKEMSAAAWDTWWRPRRWRSQSGRWWASRSLCCGGRGEDNWERGWSLKIQSHSRHKELGREGEREKRQIEWSIKMQTEIKIMSFGLEFNLLTFFRYCLRYW